MSQNRVHFQRILTTVEHWSCNSVFWLSMILPKRRWCSLVISTGVAAFTLQLSAQTSDVTRTCAAAATVPFDEAARSAIDKVQPETPPLAKQMRIQGTVRIEVCVSETGKSSSQNR